MNSELFKATAHEVKAEQLIRLADTIIKRHQEAGPDSPLKGSLVAEMNFKNNAIREKHEEGLRYLKVALEAFYERDLLIGIAARDNEDNNKNTLQSCIERVHQSLNNIYPGQEEMCRQWGFNVEYRMSF